MISKVFKTLLLSQFVSLLCWFKLMMMLLFSQCKLLFLQTKTVNSNTIIFLFTHHAELETSLGVNNFRNEQVVNMYCTITEIIYILSYIYLSTRLFFILSLYFLWIIWQDIFLFILDLYRIFISSIHIQSILWPYVCKR